MRKIMRSAGAILLAAVAIMSVSAATAAASTSAASSYEGCASGTACLYAGPSWAVDHWVTYGSHNLSNVYGVHRFFNNQTGGAGAYLCTGYNGGGSCFRLNAYVYTDIDFTPINSVVLTPQ